MIKTQNIAPSQPEATLRRILKSAPQDLWLDTIRRTSGPIHDPLVFWMINQMECDFAVAVHAFYRSDPGQFLDLLRPLPAKPDPSDIFAQLLINWDAGFYRTHDLAVENQDADPRQRVRIGQKVMTRPRASLPFSIPNRFLEPSGGITCHLPPDLSPDHAKHLWPLYAKLGLQVQPAAPGLRRKMAKLAERLLLVKLPQPRI